MIVDDKSEPVLGKTLGNFVVTATLGEGGMGEVFLAEHRRMGRKVAIKVLRPQFSVDPGAVERLFNEARATAMIPHSGIVQIFDCDVFEGRAYLVMEFLEGQSLREHMATWKSPNTLHVVWLAAQIASVLQAAHEKGIVHRDLKPDNVFLTNADGPHAAGRVKVLDFGIAKLRRAPTEGAHLTGTGMLLGTPVYMSPEQCRGNGTVQEQSDIYSLGCMMFEMLCGAPPFESSGGGELIAAHLYREPPLLIDRAPQTPAWLCTLVAQMLSKDPDLRPASMRHVEQTLLQGGDGQTSSTVRPGATVMLPSSALPSSAPSTAPATTTLRAAAHGSTLTTNTGARRAWLLPGAAGFVVVVAIGATWAVMSRGAAPTSEPAPLTQPMAAPAPEPPLPAAIPPAEPPAADAAAPPLDARPSRKPSGAPSPRPKRKTATPFPGFDEL